LARFEGSGVGRKLTSGFRITVEVATGFADFGGPCLVYRPGKEQVPEIIVPFSLYVIGLV
jgi:hypothetical protein